MPAKKSPSTKKSEENPPVRQPLATPLGHSTALADVQRAVAENRFAHAWIISGPPGIGKASFALHVARLLLGGEAAMNDDTHPVSLLLAARTHPDFYHLDTTDKDEVKKSEISVEKIRALNQMLRLTAAHAGWRVALIDSIDLLSRNAANALLKILEEPPKKVAFLLPCNRIGAVPLTLVSRCQRLRLKPLQRREFHDVLMARNPKLTQDEADLLHLLSRGSPGVAENLIELGGAQLYHDLIETLSQLGERHGPSLYHQFANQIGSDRSNGAWMLFSSLIEGILWRNLQGKIYNGSSEIPLEQERALFPHAHPGQVLDTLHWLMEELPKAERQYLNKTHAGVTAFAKIEKLATTNPQQLK